MKLKMLVQIVGPEFSLDPGDEKDFPQSEAVRLISAGYAVPVTEVQIELAIEQPARERRDGRRMRGKRGR